MVPLFETVKDLRGAGSVIRKLLSIDWYCEHIIKNHNGHQEVFQLVSYSYDVYLSISRICMKSELKKSW